MTSPTTQVYFFQDFVNGTGLKLDGWEDQGSDEWYYGGTACARQNDTSSSFTFFNGVTEMRLFGFCHERAPVQVFLNEGITYNTSIVNGRYSQVYQTPMLPQDLNNVTITKLDASSSCCFDLILAAPTSKDFISGGTLMVDDFYDKIQYTGSWQAHNNESHASIVVGNFVMTPLMNTTHQTSTVGDTMRFAFSGTNVKVFGSPMTFQDGNFSISYAIDDGSKTSRSFNTDNPSALDLPTFTLLDTGPIPLGDHTLTLTLTASFNQPLVIDYILYTPSFDTLADMPNLPVPSVTTSSPPPSTDTTQTNTSQTPTNTPQSNTTPPSTTPIGPIVGGSIGGVFLFLISCMFVFWCIGKRRRLRNPRYSYAEEPPQIDIYTGYPIDPYTLKPTWAPSPPVTATKRSPTSPITPTSAAVTTPDTPAPADNLSPVELVRRVDDLSRQFERLQSAVIPPAYESQPASP